MDRSLSTIDTVWSTLSLSLSLRLLRLFVLDLPSSLLLSIRIATFHRFERRTENSTSKIEWKTSSNFQRRLFQPEIVIPMETWVITRTIGRGLIMRYASRSFSILASLGYHHGFHVTRRLPKLTRLDLIAVSETRCQVFNSIPFFFFSCARVLIVEEH